MTALSDTAKPRLAAKARLKWDEVRQKHLLLFPEGLLVLNPTASQQKESDLDLVVALDSLPKLVAALPSGAAVERFSHSVNVTFPDSDLRLQFQTDPRYMDFLARATVSTVLGTELRVASPEDVLLGKVWAASDATRRSSKRMKDLADIARLLERFPELRRLVPPNLLDKLM